MATLFLEYGYGFSVSPNGGLLIAQGWDETRQALERIAMTASKTVLPSGLQVDPEYLADSTFGLNFRLRVGQLLAGQAAQELASTLAAAAAAAPGTNASHPPAITVTQVGNVFNVTCVVYLTNGQSGTLTYQVS